MGEKPNLDAAVSKKKESESSSGRGREIV